MPLFNPGEVVHAISNKAIGHKKKPKYHLCVSSYCAQYLFINSKAWIGGGSFKITNKEVPKLTNPVSYISCNNLLPISDDYMKENRAKRVGKLPPGTILRLIDYADTCDVLSEEEKEIIIDGLSSA